MKFARGLRATLSASTAVFILTTSFALPSASARETWTPTVIKGGLVHNGLSIYVDQLATARYFFASAQEKAAFDSALVQCNNQNTSISSDFNCARELLNAYNKLQGLSRSAIENFIYDKARENNADPQQWAKEIFADVPMAYDLRRKENINIANTSAVPTLVRNYATLIYKDAVPASIASATTEKDAIRALMAQETRDNILSLKNMPEQSETLYSKTYFINLLKDKSAADIIKIDKQAGFLDRLYGARAVAITIGDKEVENYTEKVMAAPTYADIGAIQKELAADIAKDELVEQRAYAINYISQAPLDMALKQHYVEKINSATEKGQIDQIIMRVSMVEKVQSMTSLTEEQKDATELLIINSADNELNALQISIDGFEQLLADAPQIISSMPFLTAEQINIFTDRLNSVMLPSDVDSIINDAKTQSERNRADIRANYIGQINALVRLNKQEKDSFIERINVSDNTSDMDQIIIQAREKDAQAQPSLAQQWQNFMNNFFVQG